MKPASRLFQAAEIMQRVVSEFGAAKTDIQVEMRQIDDVPRFIKKMEKAHKETAQSTLHFGPSGSQDGIETG
jgi:hypothetical protein